MTKRLLFAIAVLAAVAITLIGCGSNKGPDIYGEDISWSYVKSPSGKCYEVGTSARLGGYSFTVAGQADNSYCK